MKGLKDGSNVTNLHISENENLEGNQRQTTNHLQNSKIF